MTMPSPRPVLRPFGRIRLPAPTGSESADFDARAIEEVGVPQPVLMENAGRSAAQVLQRLHPRGAVVGLVGSGNNGGDALVLLRTLAAWGRPVAGVLVADREDGTLLHGWSLDLREDGELEDEGWARLLDGAVVVDGILGTGVRGAPRERQARAIERVNAAGRPVLSIDIPSGVDSATGSVPGAAIRAATTVAFGAPKLGSLLHPGRAHAGRLVAVEMGFPPLDSLEAGARVATPAWARSRLPVREPDTHKNAVGRLLVVAGGQGMAGAAIMAVRAGFRAGAGYVQVTSDPTNRAILQGAVPEAVWVDPETDGALEDALGSTDAVAAGPGLGTGEAAEELLRRVLEVGEAPLVLDADGLNLAAAGRTASLPAVARRRPLLLTPHPGEMARLVNHSVGAVAEDRVTAAREAAHRWGCVVLLKGAPSLVASPGEPVAVDAMGSSDLAVAGMGDVLTGAAGGLLAQGLSPGEAGPVALYLTGRAARLAGRGAGLTPADVVRRLAEARSEEVAPHTELDLPFLLFDQDPAR
jgi:NAD(P)H-hydrate epimerase